MDASVKYLGGLNDPLQVISEDENGLVTEPDVYTGYDPVAGQHFVFHADGDAITVSDEMAARLQDDFPGFFEVDGKTAGEKAKPKRRTGGRKKPDADPQAELRKELLEHGRDELNAAAAELGVEDADQLDTDEAVVDAILAKHAEQAN